MSGRGDKIQKGNKRVKVLIMHNDLRVYWRRRLLYLRNFLKSKNVDLYAVELFGKGSPYDFDPFNRSEPWRDCLFPDNSNRELSKYQIKDKVFAKLDEINPDIVIAGSIVFYSGALGLRWAKKNQKKFIMFDDAKPSWVKRNFFVQGIKNLITRQADALWLPSAEYDKEYTALYSKKNTYYLYGYNCVDNDLFKFKGKKKFRNNKIICVGRLVPKKNVRDLLAAWKFVEQHNDSYRLVVLGDGPLLPELKAYAGSIKLNRVTFAGAAANDEIPKYLHEADAFISPSLYESWGLVANEAMAAGLPVLLSDKFNAAGTLLKDGINGYIFDPYDLEGIQKKLIDFINLPHPEKEGMSANSLKIIAGMSFDHMGNELLAAINFLKTKPSKRPWLLQNLIINLWYGRYNTAEWDKVRRSLP
jgi:glycosyltransferase involved in cell wall biosynthesis